MISGVRESAEAAVVRVAGLPGGHRRTGTAGRAASGALSAGGSQGTARVLALTSAAAFGPAARGGAPPRRRPVEGPYGHRAESGPAAYDVPSAAHPEPLCVQYDYASSTTPAAGEQKRLFAVVAQPPDQRESEMLPMF